jgi:hypothetical protein
VVARVIREVASARREGAVPLWLADRSAPLTTLQLSSRDVVLILERIDKTIGYPKTVRVDQGSEFVDIRAYQKGVVLEFSRGHCLGKFHSCLPGSAAPQGMLHPGN